jgi:putative ABC transport system permease protein
MDRLLSDVRYVWRRLWRTPLANGLIVLSLAVGVGVNLTVFKMVDAVLLKPLPFGAPDRIISVIESRSEVPGPGSPISPPNFLDVKAGSRSLVHLAAWADASSIVETPGLEPERVHGAAVSADFFPALELAFAEGRGFTSDEDRPGGPKVAVISTRFRQRFFASSSRVVGASVILDEQPTTVVGVIPSPGSYPGGVDFWVPLGLQAGEGKRTSRWLSTVGRLRPGVSRATAQAELSNLARLLVLQYPTEDRDLHLTAVPLHEMIVGRARPALLLLTAVVAVVILIACVNATSILLARSGAQEAELAVRTALGAPASRLLRMALIESSMLSLLAGASGLLLSTRIDRLAMALAGESLPLNGLLHTDLRSLAASFVLSIAAGLLIGIAPSLQRRVRSRPGSVLGSSGRSGAGRSRAILKMVRIAAVAEVSLAVLALLCAGLLTRSLLALLRVEPGFRSDRSVAADFSLPETRYGTPERQVNYYDRLLGELASAPGIVHCGIIFPMPFSDAAYASQAVPEGQETAAEQGAAVAVRVAFISPDLPAAMGLPLLRGRGFDGQDDRTRPPVALVGEGAARRFWPGRQPLGKRIALAPFAHGQTWITVVGVVGDMHQARLGEVLPLTVYRPIRQVPRPEATLVVRGRTAAGEVPVDLLRTSFRKIDPNLALEDTRTLGGIVARAARGERFQALLVVVFAMLALGLATAGIYGVISYGVTVRTQEIGIRMALGADRAKIRNLLLWQGVKLVLAGFAAGVVAFLLGSHLLAAFLFGVGQHDPATLAAVFVIVLVVGCVAVSVPVHRSTSVDPTITLRG